MQFATRQNFIPHAHMLGAYKKALQSLICHSVCLPRFFSLIHHFPLSRQRSFLLQNKGTHLDLA